MIGTVSIVLLVVILALFAWSTYDRLTYFRKLGLDGPTPMPIFGNLFGFKIGVPAALEKWTKEYGKTFGISRGAKKAIFTSDLDFAKEILVKRFKNFAARRTLPLRPKCMSCDIVALKGDRWKAMRETVALTFSKTKVQKMVPMLAECADVTMNNIDCNHENDKGVFDMQLKMSAFGIDVGAFCFFASKLGTPAEKSLLMKHASMFWIRVKTVYFPWMFITLFPWLEPLFKLMGCSVHPVESVEFFSNMLKDIMASRKNDPNASKYLDFLQLMLNSRVDQDKETSNGRLVQKRTLSEMEIFAMCMNFFTGNLETTPSALSYVVYMLAMHPDVQERVIAEIDEVMKDGINYENVNKLTYTDMVFREVLRMYPIVATIARVCEEDCVVQGIKIPKGMLVEVAVNVIHFNPEYWPDPHRFDPERFSPENKDKIDSMTWLAFGQGPRMCIGYRFAMIEMSVLVTRLLQKYRLETCQETEIPPKQGKRGLLGPENGINIRLVPRQDVVA